MKGLESKKERKEEMNGDHQHHHHHHNIATRAVYLVVQTGEKNKEAKRLLKHELKVRGHFEW